LYKSPGKN
jgi:hypothetical protein